ncbi:hypothetical protein FZEAL_6891 [Fusarium zealandicum]|uniref:Peptidase S8/S53 domain-containing protein n=1 Tax=Fusarium zealandicum TaxID=1053134 RepID=A0A8H4UHQ8_9HYPO|nr:hypothetical protein FZEAL_6891 [Fusarium zealandicum]
METRLPSSPAKLEDPTQPLHMISSAASGGFWVDISHERLLRVHSIGGRLLAVDSQTQTNHERHRKNAVVALIDDGVDSCDSAYSQRGIEGKTVDYQGGGAGHYYISAKGQSAKTARNGGARPSMPALQLQPSKQLFKDVNIISMSWMIPVSQNRSEQKEVPDAVLERGCKQNVLMFCSSSDKLSSIGHYPSAFKHQRSFFIGAAHNHGSPYGHVGKGNDFISPGVNINTVGGSTLPAYLADKTCSTKYNTGSSIAAALAAGLAATITYCFNASALAIITAMVNQRNNYLAGSELVNPEHVGRIAEYETLNKTFIKIRTKGLMANELFIPVWERPLLKLD